MDSILWSEEPLILIEPKYFTQFYPDKQTQTPQEYENAIVRMSLYTNIITSLYYDNFIIPLLFFTATLIYLYYSRKPVTEKLTEIKEEKKECTKPTLSNPFMNRNPIDAKMNPACPITPESKEDMHTYFQNNLYRDVSDVFGKKSSERNFYTTPGSFADWDSQTKFAKWLYNNEEICKIDQNYCVPYIDPRNLRKSVPDN